MTDFMKGLEFYNQPNIVQRLFFPRRESAPDRDHPKALNHFVEVAPQIRIGCRFFPSHQDAPNLLYFHGNGETAPDYDYVAPLYQQLGINLFVADYRGYGMSDGHPSCSAMIGDAHPLFQGFSDFLKSNGYTGHFWIMGRSLGSAPAIDIAWHYQKQFQGLIVESGFASARNQLCRIGMVHLLKNNEAPIGFGNDLKIREVTIPTLIIHGEGDEIIPVTEGRTLYNLSGAEQKHSLFIPRAGHNDLLLLGLDAYMGAIAAFVQKA
ncbi:MAG: alpha/beta hydrolase [Syntrophaceae bacterium]|nr:alpha/beta hydrolase [Syntrophaceae bacterium]